MIEQPLPDVVAVLVTYGARWTLLREVLEEVVNRQPGVAKVVLVDNASSYEVAERLGSEGFESVRLVSMGANEGSAAGFAAGIAVALSESNAELIWLLDDDNKPGPGCLTRLLSTYCILGRNPHNALLALRRSRQDQVDALCGQRRLFVRPNSFLGFHLVEVPGKLLRHCRRATAPSRLEEWDRPVVAVGYAPYGGFLFHRSWIDRVGLPDHRFFLYGDDHEFTARIVIGGGRIFLCSFCEVTDLEVSWALKDQRAPALVSKDSNPTRVFYTVRNRVFWEATAHISARSVYLLNAVLYLSLLITRAIVAERAPIALVRRLRLVFRAISDGIRGKLGKAEVV